MRRAVYFCCVVLSALVCLCTIALFVRSFWTGDLVTVSRVGDGTESFQLRQVFVQSNSGYVTLVIQSQHADGAFAADALRMIVRRSNEGIFPRGASFEAWDASPTKAPFRWKSLGIVIGSHRRPLIAGQTSAVEQTRSISFPHAHLIVLSAVLPLWWAWMWRRSWRQRRVGECAGCGYDLRASSGRCPECGRDIDVEPPQPARREK